MYIYNQTSFPCLFPSRALLSRSLLTWVERPLQQSCVYDSREALLVGSVWCWQGRRIGSYKRWLSSTPLMIIVCKYPHTVVHTALDSTLDRILVHTLVHTLVDQEVNHITTPMNHCRGLQCTPVIIKWMCTFEHVGINHSSYNII